MDWGYLVAAVITGALGGGGVVAWIKARSENRVNDSEAWGTLVSNLQNELTRQAERLTRLEMDIDQLKSENDRLERRNQILEDEKAQLIAENTRLTCELQALKTAQE